MAPFGVFFVLLEYLYIIVSARQTREYANIRIGSYRAHIDSRFWSALSSVAIGRRWLLLINTIQVGDLNPLFCQCHVEGGENSPNRRAAWGGLRGFASSSCQRPCCCILLLVMSVTWALIGIGGFGARAWIRLRLYTGPKIHLGKDR